MQRRNNVSQTAFIPPFYTRLRPPSPSSSSLRPRIPRLFLYSPSVTNSGRKSLLEMTSRVHLLKRGSTVTVLFSVGILEARCIIVNTNALLRKHRCCAGTKRNERAFAEKSVLCVKQFYLSCKIFGRVILVSETPQER